MEFKELLTARYATKLFQPKAVPEETMQELLEMIRLAPSGLNIQPFDQNERQGRGGCVLCH